MRLAVRAGKGLLWPLNTALMLLTVILFWRSAASSRQTFARRRSDAASARVVQILVVACAVLPVFSLPGAVERARDDVEVLSRQSVFRLYSPRLLLHEDVTSSSQSDFSDAIMGSDKGDYREEFPVGSVVRIAGRPTLERFVAEWKWHHPLDPSQLQFAGQRSEVERVSFYHGGDALYELKGIPGIWHEPCLRADA